MVQNNEIHCFDSILTVASTEGGSVYVREENSENYGFMLGYILGYMLLKSGAYIQILRNNIQKERINIR